MLNQTDKALYFIILEWLTVVNENADYCVAFLNIFIQGSDILKKLNDFQSQMAALKEFLAKEDTLLDRYDLFSKKVYLTINKPEPQAGEFAKILKHACDSFTGLDWKIMYK